MKLYTNIMEDVLELQFDDMKNSLGCCCCEQCRSDIIAYALNQLPPRYVVTRSGQLLSRADTLRNQHSTDICSALVRASMVIKANPRH